MKTYTEWAIIRLPDGTEMPSLLCWDSIKAYRNMVLLDTDWTQLEDSPLDVEQKSAWATYRQELRDLPQNNPNINNINWPVPPGE